MFYGSDTPLSLLISPIVFSCRILTGWFGLRVGLMLLALVVMFARIGYLLPITEESTWNWFAMGWLATCLLYTYPVRAYIYRVIHVPEVISTIPLGLIIGLWF